jgi:phosphoribosylaminoimidazole-succinocarboxamide synthase
VRHLYSGKVRDIYELDSDTLLFVASDRISAFDVIMPEVIPDKGRVLTAMTAFWCELLTELAPNHLVAVVGSEVGDVDVGGAVGRAAGLAGDGDLSGRAMVVRRAEMLPLECIVRGYLSGSAWKEYRSQGTMHGRPLPQGLRESDPLPHPVFTPSTKAVEGHDQNISFAEAVDLVGAEVAGTARDLCVAAYRRGADWAAERGIIIADTKFELGFIDGRLAICDEILTPDSSRFWPADAWEPGTSPPSFDKQPLRDWLEATGWDKFPPAPHLPPDVVAAARHRYVTAYQLITGKPFADWFGVGE